jgi:hypothetical protein
MEKHTAIAKGWRKRQIMFKEPEDEAFEAIEKAQQRNALLVDKGCAERGCMGYDSRDGDTPVKMSIQRPWVELTEKQFSDCLVEGDPCEALAEPEAWAVMQVVAAKLKELNT